MNVWYFFGGFLIGWATMQGIIEIFRARELKRKNGGVK